MQVFADHLLSGDSEADLAAPVVLMIRRDPVYAVGARYDRISQRFKRFSGPKPWRWCLRYDGESQRHIFAHV